MLSVSRVVLSVSRVVLSVSRVVVSVSRVWLGESRWVLCVYRVDCLLLGDILFDRKAALHILGGKLFLVLGQAEMDGPNILRLRTVCCVSDGK